MPWSRFDRTWQEPDAERTLSYAEAVREAIDQAMRLDPRVFAIGLDADDEFGVFGTMLGLTHSERVIGTPISENAMTGVALGAALCGLRPIHVHLRNDFMLVAMDQIANYVAKWEDMFDRQVRVPLVIRSVIGRGWGCGAQHSQTLHGLFAHVPGLQVVMPATPRDAKGLLLSAVKDDSPVLFFEHRWLYKNTGPVPEEMYAIPIGRGKLVRRGNALTVVACSLALVHAMQAVDAEKLDVDLIDPRTVKPLDIELILDSVARTGRLLVVDYDFPFGGLASEIVAQCAEQAFDSLRVPPRRIAFPDRGMPASGVLERAYYPTPERLARAMRAMFEGEVVGQELLIP
ncbi:MAG: alpha-ketoacid dehydrogenase subunit beta [Planctomycetota bacterium]